MTNPVHAAKARGRQTENMVVGYLNDHGFPHAERRTLKGANDQGDITGIPGVVIEVKGDRSNKIAKWRDETVTEADNADVTFFFLVVRLEYQPVANWEVHLPLGVLCGDASHCAADMEDVWVRMDLQAAAVLMKTRGY